MTACSTPPTDPGQPSDPVAHGGTGETGNGQAPAPQTDNLEALCQELHQSLPHLWPELLPAIFKAGAKAEPFLIATFEDLPTAPGGQATLAALGRIGGEASIKLCGQLVNERAGLAVEAALALGDLPAGKADPVLLECMQDRHSDASLRAAAACSLARHGEQQQTPEFVAAIVRAGTPAGRADEKRYGLPGKSRWARERYFVQRMLRKLGHQDLCDALDSDAPWPVLEKLAPRVAKRLTAK